MDWVLEHINTIVQATTILVGIVGAFVYVRADLITLKNDMVQIRRQQDMLMESLKQLNTILTQIAVQDARLHMIEKDIDELRHRKGFID